MMVLKMTKFVLPVLLVSLTFYITVSESLKVKTDIRRSCEDIFLCPPTKNCTGWKESEFIGDEDDYEVTVCRTGKTKVLIQPLNYLWFSDVNIDYNHLSKKFYTTFKVQLTSSRILDEISKRPEFNNTQVSFMDVTQVRFVLSNPQFLQLRKEITLNEDWIKVSENQSKDKFARLQFSADNQETAGNIRSMLRFPEFKSGNAVKSTLKIEVKTSHTTNIIRTSLRTPRLNETESEYAVSLMKNTEPKPRPMTQIIFPISPDFRWILMQRRESAGFDFNRNWTEYKNGFGDWRNDFWLGLEKIYDITKDGGYGLRMEFESHKGLQRSAQWKNFRVGSEEEKYKLIISGFDTKSSAGYDYMDYSNGGGFATVDKDNSNSCAKSYGGGWWFNGCTNSHFNNQLRSSIGTSHTCVHYASFKGNTHGRECLKRVRMFIIRH